MKNSTKNNLRMGVAIIVLLIAIGILMRMETAEACGNSLRLNYQHNSEPGNTREPYIFDGVGLEATRYVGERWYVSGGLYKQVNPYFDDEHAWRATFETGFEFGGWW